MEAKKIPFRHELKHYINYADYLDLTMKLKFVTKLDENAINGKGYKIRSLYFDNFEDKAMREKINGVNGREKFRIRYYNNDPNFIRLEKKSKYYGKCYKVSEKISYEECLRLLDGDNEFLRDETKPLFFELYLKMQYQNLVPKNIVDYEREAYIHDVGNVRITIDSKISSSNNTKEFFNKDLPMITIQDATILEVKYDNFLPEFIRGVTALNSRRATSFSKYTNTRINY